MCILLSVYIYTTARYMCVFFTSKPFFLPVDIEKSFHNITTAGGVSLPSPCTTFASQTKPHSSSFSWGLLTCSLSPGPASLPPPLFRWETPSSILLLVYDPVLFVCFLCVCVGFAQRDSSRKELAGPGAWSGTGEGGGIGEGDDEQGKGAREDVGGPLPRPGQQRGAEEAPGFLDCYTAKTLSDTNPE